MNFQQHAQFVSQLTSRYNCIDKTVVLQIFCSLEAFRQLLFDGLLDNSRAGKPN